MNEMDAVEVLRERLPEFEPRIGEHLSDNDGEILLHVLMGDLGRFYIERAQDEGLRRRYWGAVETLATDGDEAVKNAIHVSLIEWFLSARGDTSEVFLAAKRYQGPVTTEMASQYSD